MTKDEKTAYDDYMKNLGISQGMLETAKWEGKLEAQTEANRNFTVSLITSTNFDDVKIAILVGVDAAWVAEIRKEISK